VYTCNIIITPLKDTFFCFFPPPIVQYTSTYIEGVVFRGDPFNELITSENANVFEDISFTYYTNNRYNTLFLLF